MIITLNIKYWKIINSYDRVIVLLKVIIMLGNYYASYDFDSIFLKE